MSAGARKVSVLLKQVSGKLTGMTQVSSSIKFVHYLHPSTYSCLVGARIKQIIQYGTLP